MCRCARTWRSTSSASRKASCSGVLLPTTSSSLRGAQRRLGVSHLLSRAGHSADTVVNRHADLAAPCAHACTAYGDWRTLRFQRQSDPSHHCSHAMHLSLGMTMSVSTFLRRVSTPSEAWFPRRRPSKVKGYVTTPTVSTPASRERRATTGAAPVPVPPPMPAVMNACNSCTSSELQGPAARHRVCQVCRCWCIAGVVSTAAMQCQHRQHHDCLQCGLPACKSWYCSWRSMPIGAGGSSTCAVASLLTATHS
jgi:hypothetical protein